MPDPEFCLPPCFTPMILAFLGSLVLMTQTPSSNSITHPITMKYLSHLNRNFLIIEYSISSVQFSHSVVSDSLRSHESQHARPPCPSPTPGVHSDSHPSNQWCHPAISSSVVPFSSCPQSLPPSESFPMSQLFAWGGQSTGVSALASVLPKNTQDWILEWVAIPFSRGSSWPRDWT